MRWIAATTRRTKEKVLASTSQQTGEFRGFRIDKDREAEVAAVRIPADVHATSLLPSRLRWVAAVVYLTGSVACRSWRGFRTCCERLTTSSTGAKRSLLLVLTKRMYVTGLALAPVPLGAPPADVCALPPLCRYTARRRLRRRCESVASTYSGVTTVRSMSSSQSTRARFTRTSWRTTTMMTEPD